MGRNESRRQKQLAKKKAKRQEKRTQIARETSTNPTIRLVQAANWPIETTLVPADLWDEGIGQLIIARRESASKLACGFFLVDTLCLGVKDAYWRTLGPAELSEIVHDIERELAPLERVSPECFAKIIFGAVAFAQSFGFPPHPDYSAPRMLLDGIDPSLCTETFEYGEYGVPLYLNGPDETPEMIRTILHRLREFGGRHDLINLSDDVIAEIEGPDEPPSTRAWRSEE